MENLYASLLKTWCDRLISLQVKGTGVKQLDGGFLCPACKVIHGRCGDAIFPMMLLAQRTGEEKYLSSARALFAFQENMLCDDGSLYNDGNSAWNGITVFAAIALCEALDHCGELLEAEERAAWRARLTKMGDWLLNNIGPDFPSNINYRATNAGAMALLGRYLGREDYLRHARLMADFSMRHFTDAGFLRGEGKPIDLTTPRGCHPIDLGYNVEESVPSLVKCALALNDSEMLEQLKIILRQQLNFMLPDGGWNNSFGSRNNKWTYWGSRTSDGCEGAYGLLGREEPLFAEACRRNTELLLRCTHDGLLYGGPQYFEHGEPPCVHHTFCHANAIAVALRALDGAEPSRTELPLDAPGPFLAHDRDIDTWRFSVGPWRGSVTGFDYDIHAGHATGGTLSMLWHEKTGPVMLSSVVDYWLVEPHNMQLPLEKARHRALTPRVELMQGGRRFAQCYDTHASIQASLTGECVRFEVAAALVDQQQNPLPDGATFAALTYEISGSRAVLSGRVYGTYAKDAVLVLPVIPAQAQVLTVPVADPPQHIFFLTGGFGAEEYRIRPDGNGCFRAEIRL